MLKTVCGNVKSIQKRHTNGYRGHKEEPQAFPTVLFKPQLRSQSGTLETISTQTDSQESEEHNAEPMTLSKIPIRESWNSSLLLSDSKAAARNDKFPGQYQYMPFSKNTTIRLLQLYSDSDDTALQGQLRHFEIEKSPSFRAISYAWGEQTLPQELLLEGKTLKITQSLNDVLQQIRRSNDDSWLWADAVCINQQDVQERGHQVKLMKQIYRNAEEVFIWLGRDDGGDASESIETIKEIASESESASKISNLNERDLLTKFFSHSWFRRVWVFQEAVLAKSAAFYWGGEQIKWDQVVTAADEIWEGRKESASSESWNAASIVVEMQVARDYMSDDSPEYSVVALAQSMRMSHCADDRDRIFAMIGLDMKTEECLVGIEPDYTQSTDEVYCDFARRVLQQGRSLRILAKVRHKPDLRDWSPGCIPSWVPYWNSHTEWAMYYNRYNSSSDLEATRAPADRFPETSSDEIPHLQLDGFIYSNIKARTKTAFQTNSVWRNDFSRFTSQIIGCWDELIKSIIEDPSHKNDTHELAIQFNDVLLEGLVKMSVRGDTRSVFKYLVEFCRDNGQEIGVEAKSMGNPKSTILAVLETALSKLQELEDKFGKGYMFQNAEIRFLHRLYFESCCSSTVFYTEANRLGTGPSSIREGDIVCILAGACTPFVLRKQDNFYRLVGAAYVYGIMDGEAVADWKADNGNMQSFEIR
jgi:hypothetical protein